MTVTLMVNGTPYGGWTSLSAEASIENLSGGFSLAFTDRWGAGMQTQGIIAGDACTLLLDEQTIITGYVDELNIDYSADGHSLSVSGRDKAADLIDCSAVTTASQWANLKLEEIVGLLAAPFGITVKTEISTGDLFQKFSIQQGETVHEALERLCKLRGVLCISDAQGGLIITRAGSGASATALIEGENILSATLSNSVKERFSQIICKGQQQGDDFKTSGLIRGSTGASADTEIKRYRPLLLQAEGQASHKTAGERAAWEVATRKAKGMRISITVAGWGQSNGGSLWRPNTTAFVSSKMLGIKEPMLISGVNYSLDESGAKTVLELVNADAYSVLAGAI